MRFSRWIPSATNTHSQYVILFDFLLQQWLHKRASELRHTYIVCLAYESITLISFPSQLALTYNKLICLNEHSSDNYCAYSYHWHTAVFQTYNCLILLPFHLSNSSHCTLLYRQGTQSHVRRRTVTVFVIFYYVTFSQSLNTYMKAFRIINLFILSPSQQKPSITQLTQGKDTLHNIFYVTSYYRTPFYSRANPRSPFCLFFFSLSILRANQAIISSQCCHLFAPCCVRQLPRCSSASETSSGTSQKNTCSFVLYAPCSTAQHLEPRRVMCDSITHITV